MTLTSSAAPLEYQEIDDPAPQRIPRDQRKREVLGLLLGLPVGGKGIEVNRKGTTMEFYANRLRKEYPEVRFLVRGSKEGWCRIWRVK